MIALLRVARVGCSASAHLTACRLSAASLLLSKAYTNAPNLTTKTTITDHVTGEVITLADPEYPELGDYKNSPPVLAQNKDPYVKYDFQQNRRNFNDPLNIDEDLYDIWSPDYYQTVSDKTALKHNAVFFSLFFGIVAMVSYFELNVEKPAMPRSFPYNGLAKYLGSGREEDDAFFQVRPDVLADSLGVIPEDPEEQAQRNAYVKANAGFIGP